MASSPSESQACPRNGGVTAEARPSNGSMVERLCAYELCRAMEDLMLCARCRGTWYCSKEHQKQHWGEHKKSCKVSPTATATATAGTTPARVPCARSLPPMPEQTAGGTEILFQGRGGSGVCPKRDPSAALGPPKASPDPTEAERAKVQEDIAQFSANIRRKPSYTLTPYETDQPGGAGGPEAKRLGRTEEGEAGAGEGMPPGQQPAVMMPETNHALDVSKHMRKFGICVVDKFLKPEAGEAILEEVMHLREMDAFTNGQLVTTSAGGPSSAKDIRGDMITWTDGRNPETQNIGYLISKMDSIVLQCKGLLEGFKNINGRSKAMVACYPGNGAHYVKHVDNPNEDGRCVTCIYYLNKDWDTEKMGGNLRLYPRSQNVIANVDPIFNRLIFFWSDIRNPHEVMPAFNTRYAITVWYFDSVERKKALAANS